MFYLAIHNTAGVPAQPVPKIYEQNIVLTGTMDVPSLSITSLNFPFDKIVKSVKEIRLSIFFLVASFGDVRVPGRCMSSHFMPLPAADFTAGRQFVECFIFM
jgi:hypothetical protein